MHIDCECTPHFIIYNIKMQKTSTCILFYGRYVMYVSFLKIPSKIVVILSNQVLRRFCLIKTFTSFGSNYFIKSHRIASLYLCDVLYSVDECDVMWFELDLISCDLQTFCFYLYVFIQLENTYT